MDTFSHAAWGFATLRWRGSRPAWLGVVAGASPDLLFYLPYSVEQARAEGFRSLFLTGSFNMWKTGGPPLPPILAAAYTKYYIYSHSLVLLTAVLLLLFTLRQRSWLWLGIPYGLHILMDIPTHERFAVQPFFPLSDWAFVGLTWGDPRIFWPHLILLIGTLLWVRKKYGSTRTTRSQSP